MRMPLSPVISRLLSLNAIDLHVWTGTRRATTKGKKIWKTPGAYRWNFARGPQWTFDRAKWEERRDELWKKTKYIKGKEKWKIVMKLWYWAINAVGMSGFRIDASNIWLTWTGWGWRVAVAVGRRRWRWRGRTLVAPWPTGKLERFT